MELIVSPAALKQLQALPRRDRDALLARVAAFAADPFAVHPWALPMQGAPNRARLRHGDWRAVVLIVRENDTVILERAGNRKEVYR